MILRGGLRRMTVRQVAKAMGISHALVMLIERGALAKIARGLGLHPDEVSPIIARHMRRFR